MHEYFLKFDNKKKTKKKTRLLLTILHVCKFYCNTTVNKKCQKPRAVLLTVELQYNY